MDSSDAVSPLLWKLCLQIGSNRGKCLAKYTLTLMPILDTMDTIPISFWSRSWLQSMATAEAQSTASPDHQEQSPKEAALAHTPFTLSPIQCFNNSSI